MVWSLNNITSTPPPCSAGHSGTKMFVFGGLMDQYEYNKGIRVFDTDTNCWLRTPTAQLRPGERNGHSAFNYNGELIIFGGVGGIKYDALNDLWEFNPETFSWKQVTPKGTGPSQMYCWYCCIVGDRLIAFASGPTCINTHILDLSPSLKTLCKLAVIQYGLDQSELTHDIRWELAAMTNNSNK